MKKYLRGVLILGAFVILVLVRQMKNTGSLLNTFSSSASGTGSSNVASVTAGPYKDGTYTGSIADAFYGNMQVQAVIAGGKLTDVILLKLVGINFAVDI